MKYRAEIDGLRALAVLPVILFHAGFEGFSGGFVGVDVFFVISGYLITSIIISEMAEGRFSIVNFYERRVRRILPPLYFLIFLITPIVIIYYPPHSAKDFSQSLVSVVVFLSNYFFFLETDYFNPFADTSPLIHTWSLSIEEQFYLLFPMTLLLFMKTTSATRIILFGLLTVAGFFYSIHQANVNSALSYFNFFTRFWEILFGCCVAFILFRNELVVKSHALRNICSIAGFIMIIAGMVLINDVDPYPNYLSTLPVVGTGLIILCCTHHAGGITHRLLSNRTLVFIGLISYALYLWHQPIFAIYRQVFIAEITLTSFMFLLIPVFALSMLSYFAVEKYFRNKANLSRHVLFSVFALMSVAIVAFGYLGHKKQGFIEYKLNSLPKEYRSIVIDLEKVRSDRIAFWANMLSKKTDSFSSDKKKILIFGDSKAEDLFVSLHVESRFQEDYEVAYIRWDNQCMNSLESISTVTEGHGCFEENSNVLQKDLLNQADILLIANTWTYDSNSKVALAIKDLASSKKIYVFSTANFNDLTSLSFQIAKSGISNVEEFLYDNIRLDWRRQSDDLKQKLAGIENVYFVEKLEFFCDLSLQKCDLLNPAIIWDSGHLTIEGSYHLGGKLYEFFKGKL